MLGSWRSSHKPLTGSQPRSAHCGSSMGRRVWASTPSSSRSAAMWDFWWRTWVRLCLRASSDKSSNPRIFVSRVSRSWNQAVAIRNPSRTALPHSLHCIKCVRASGVESAITHRTLQLASVGGAVRVWKRPTVVLALPALWTHAA